MPGSQSSPSTAFARRTAIRHLEGLARDLRDGKHGLEVMVEPGLMPFPTLLVRAPGITWARIAAGATHFWWIQRHRKQLIGPVDPAKRADVTLSIAHRFNAIRQARRVREAGQAAPR